MTIESPPVPIRVKRPFHPFLAHVAAACLLGCFLTDLTYWRSEEMMWADFSAWLVTVGVVLGVLALIAGLVDALSGRLFDLGSAGRLQIVAYLLALIVSVFNALVHTRDAWTSVVPWGLTLSSVVAVILIFAGAMGCAATYRLRREVTG
jgi:uncharacterized membrane protein